MKRSPVIRKKSSLFLRKRLVNRS